MDEGKIVEDKIEEDVQTLIDGDRIIGFSDAVFAFAATLLVLKIDLPNIPPDLLKTQFSAELWKLWPTYAANFFSFLIIAYYWRAHHTLFILIKRYDNVLVWLNILVLIFVSFLPFPIDLFGDYPAISGVVIFYTASLAVVGISLLVLWLYASGKHRLIDKNMSSRMINYHTLSNAIAPFVFTVSMPLVYFDHVIAKISWTFVVVLLFLLNRFYKVNRVQKQTFDPQPE